MQADATFIARSVLMRTLNSGRLRDVPWATQLVRRRTRTQIQVFGSLLQSFCTYEKMPPWI